MKNYLSFVMCCFTSFMFSMPVLAESVLFSFKSQSPNQTKDVVTITPKKADGTAISLNSNGLKLIGKSYFTVSISQGYMITSVKVVFTTELATSLDISCNGDFSINGKTHIWQGEVLPSVVFTNNTGQDLLYVNNIVVEYSKLPKIDDPIPSVLSGTYFEPKTIDIRCLTEDVTILYTLDKTIPAIDNGVLKGSTKIFTDPFTITQSQVVTAMAIKDFMENSTIIQENYIISAPNKDLAVKINFFELLGKKFIGGNVKPVSLEGVVETEKTQVLNLSFLSGLRSYPAIHFSEELALPSNSFIQLKTIDKDIVIEKIVIKMRKDSPGAGVSFLYINGEKKYVSSISNNIEWEGSEMNSIDIMNPDYESDGNTAYMMELTVTLKKAERVSAISDVTKLIDNNVVGYFGIDQLKVGYHNVNDLYLTDNTNWIYTVSDNGFGGKQLLNGDITTDQLICQIPVKITDPINILNTVSATASSSTVSPELNNIKTILNTNKQNNFVYIKFATFDLTSNSISDNSGTIKVEQCYGSLLEHEQSYNVNGFIGMNDVGEPVFRPTEIVRIMTGVESPKNEDFTIRNISQGVVLNSNKAQMITVYNSAGQIVYNASIAKGENELYLSSGIYFIKGETVSTKVIVNQ